MQFQFSFKHMATSPALQSYAEQKLRERIEKFVTKPIAAHVQFSVIRHQHTAHLSLEAGDGFGGIEVEHTSQDMYATVDELVDKLTAQLKKHKEKLKDHKNPKLNQKIQELSTEPQGEALDAADILKYEQGKRRANSRH